MSCSMYQMEHDTSFLYIVCAPVCPSITRSGHDIPVR